MKDLDGLFHDDASSLERVSGSDEEVAPALQKGVQIALLTGERKRLPLLTKEEILELVPRIAAGDQRAKDTMVLHNMRLVVSIAMRFRWSSLSLDDLVQEGVVGLIKAVEKYDLAHETRFSTYATWWIRSTIIEAICNTSYLIRIPAHKQDLIRGFLVCQAELLDSGVVPTVKLLAQKLEITEQQVGKIQAILKMNARPVSLDDAMPGYDSDAVVGDFIPDTTTPDPSVVLQAKQELQWIRSEVDRILRHVSDERHRAIFLKFYGFDIGLERRTLEVTGELFDITRERVRQVVKKIWDGMGSSRTKQEFEQMLAGIPALEEMAGFQLSWSGLEEKERGIWFLDMFQSTTREALSQDDFAICACHYGFDQGYQLRTEYETAQRLGIQVDLVRQVLNRLWRRLRPYAKHMTHNKVRRRAEILAMTNK